ncbi:MAG TPA: TonB-dependent receptor plug domain-containing protein [Steroidobacteraceae bacterium]|nr:TonB-dependent receptor plug domain-containing protein [Steroidobacteraceae bacterium]
MFVATLMLVAALALAPARAFADDEDTNEQPQQVVITATRHPALIQDEPLHVEAVPAEEIEENSTVQPGNLSTLLAELPGIEDKSLGAALGGVGLELRGMPARNTLVLSDGLPLLGTEPDGFDLLQMPPLDLERVEVVKGAASALYGGSALAGVLNLVSRPPTSESTVLGNVTSRGGRDLEGFFTAGGRSRWSGTLTGGINDQSREDVNGDGWADIQATDVSPCARESGGTMTGEITRSSPRASATRTVPEERCRDACFRTGCRSPMSSSRVATTAEW